MCFQKLLKFQQLLKTRVILILNFTRPQAITYTNWVSWNQYQSKSFDQPQQIIKWANHHAKQPGFKHKKDNSCKQVSNVFALMSHRLTMWRLLIQPDNMVQKCKPKPKHQEVAFDPQWWKLFCLYRYSLQNGATYEHSRRSWLK